MRPLPRRAALLGTAGLAFFAGLSVDHAARAARRGDDAFRPLDVFAEALAAIENGYVEEVRERDLVYGAIEGMTARLDPHTQFMRPEVYRALREETSGELEGVGLELGTKDGELVVVAPVADGPAAKAGIAAGDQLLAIDGTPTRDLSMPEVLKLMKGAAGTKVRLQVLRAGFKAPQTLVVVRDRIRTRSVEWRLLDRDRAHAYVAIRSFQDRTDAALKAALDAARSQLGKPLGGLVLDLRNDPGGLLEQAVRVADRFLDEGVIVSTEGRGRKPEVERAHPKDTEARYPMVVLVNRGTASASEIVAGALQDHGRAVIMGSPTFGKGSVQTLVDLEDGSGLKLTVARYYTPKHRSIQEQGITPDVLVSEVAPAARREEGPSERDLERHLRGEASRPAAAGPAGGGEAPAPSARAGPEKGPGAAAPAADDHVLRTAADYLRAAAVFRAAQR